MHEGKLPRVIELEAWDALSGSGATHRKTLRAKRSVYSGIGIDLSLSPR
jgi:hypothetical protein